MIQKADSMRCERINPAPLVAQFMDFFASGEPLSEVFEKEFEKMQIKFPLHSNQLIDGTEMREGI
jgi:hypothetical protein